MLLHLRSRHRGGTSTEYGGCVGAGAGEAVGLGVALGVAVGVGVGGGVGGAVGLGVGVGGGGGRPPRSRKGATWPVRPDASVAGDHMVQPGPESVTERPAIPVPDASVK